MNKFSGLWGNVGWVETGQEWLCSVEAYNQDDLDDGCENEDREGNQGLQFLQEDKREIA